MLLLFYCYFYVDSLLFWLMKSMLRFFSIFFILGCMWLPAAPRTGYIPVTKAILNDSPSLFVNDSNRALSSFILSTYNSNENQVRGIYVKNKLQFTITQQPTNNPGFVSTTPNTVTQFSIANNYGSIGLIAHNYLAGTQFFEIEQGDTIVLVYGTGHLVSYKVTELREYQALSPYSPYSNFVNLSKPNQTISSDNLFYDTYGVRGRLVLQTCIAHDGSDSWGRLFIIAEKIQN